MQKMKITLIVVVLALIALLTYIQAIVVEVDPVSNNNAIIDDDENALERFRAYLAVNTSHPQPNYQAAVDYLVNLAQTLGFPYQLVRLPSGFDVIVLTYQNLNENVEKKESIMLNSHTDIVPADHSSWNTDPFKPTTIDGRIYARGSQDMKSVGMQYVEAIYRLKRRNVKLNYILRIVFVPEEEIGGERGMKQFLETQEFKDLNVVFSFDEGVPVNDPETLKIFYGENAAWWFKVTCEGNVGHGSQFIKNTASSQLNKYIQKAFEFRNQQEQLITISDNADDESDVVTINLNALRGGSTTSINVVPREVDAYFDSRIPPHYNLTQLMDLYTNKWTEGTNCNVTWVQHTMVNPITDLNSPLVQRIIQFFKGKYPTIKLKYFPAATDARFVRRKGIPCLGISLLSGVPMLLHDHNEYITEHIYLKGIREYEEILPLL
jgi:aminoacylase